MLYQGSNTGSINFLKNCILIIVLFLQFYEAEITGISANTVVVKFCAYGNHEEVLKSNCLPVPTQGKSNLKFSIFYCLIISKDKWK